MTFQAPVLLALDLLGTFAFALNGALTALRVARLDIVGVVTLGMITALGGGIIRDVLLGTLPPATFSDWRYLTVAAAGGLLAFLFRRPRGRVNHADHRPGRRGPEPVRRHRRQQGTGPGAG